jgi:hypothetical protein
MNELASHGRGKHADDEMMERLSCFAPRRLAFADHVNGFVTGNGPPGAPKATKPLAGSAPAFNSSMILFKNVVEVLHGTVLTLFGYISFCLQIDSLRPEPYSKNAPRRLRRVWPRAGSR